MTTKSPRKAKAIPVFCRESEERALWKTQDASKYFDFSRAIQPSLVNLKPSNGRHSKPAP
ncbi:CopG family antitoxin [Polynucleobacter corsicus]|uniref:CopG family antitoxin n=1 Tax=Polynucleobacter corsicus TaxID=2081042 RepID=UPI001BFE2F96|nr:hypothetical protein C2747_01530 [Polynucleobacter corsicus]